MRRLATVVAVAVLSVGALPSAAAQQDPALARMRADVEWLARSPREAGTAAELAAADHVAAVLRGLGLAPASSPVPLANGRTSRNVQVSFGSGAVEILLGAHLDSVRGSPGADDNASGVAVLLEYARQLDNGTVPVPPGTTVTLVWFGAEEVLAGYPREVHHAGSRQYAAARAAFGAHPHWMLSVDMVGDGATPIAVYFDGADPAAARVLSSASGRSGAPAAVAPRGDISDHEGFARRGTPSALLWRPDNPGYHGPGDATVIDDRLTTSLRTVQAFVATAASPFATGRGMAHELLLDLLARRPDVAGAGHFGGRLDGGESPGSVGAALVGAPEWRQIVAPVARLYLAAFGRQADHGGLVHWTGLVRAGTTLDGIAANFVASPEFGARNGAPDNRGFVRLLYRNVLGREPDASGEAYWVAQLDSGRMSRARVLVSFSQSPEHIARNAPNLPVALAYAGLLRRPVDPGGLAHWSGRPIAEVVGALVASEEFRRRFP